MAAKQNASILGEAKPSKVIIKLALPATLALLAKTVYNIVDTAYIGMLKDDIALTAVGVTVPFCSSWYPLRTSLPQSRRAGWAAAWSQR